MQKVKFVRNEERNEALKRFEESKEVITKKYFGRILMNLQILRAGQFWMMIYREAKSETNYAVEQPEEEFTPQIPFQFPSLKVLLYFSYFCNELVRSTVDTQRTKKSLFVKQI